MTVPYLSEAAASPRQRWRAVLAVLVLARCSGLADGADRGPTTQSVGLSSGSDWGCLLAPERESITQPDPSFPIRFSLPVATLFGQPLQNARARACGPADIACELPISEAVGSGDGNLTLTLYWGFNGFLELRADGVVPIVFYPLGRLYEDTVYPRTLGFVTEAQLDALAQSGDGQFEADLAHATMQVYDCALRRAPGVRFGHNIGDGVGVPYYFVDDLPTGAETETDERGVGGFLNLPAQSTVFSAIRTDTSERVARRNVALRARWFTTVDLAPPGAEPP